jgi:hypothetical protein
MLIASNEQTSPTFRRRSAGWRETAIGLAAVLAFGAAYLSVRSGSGSGVAPDPDSAVARDARPGANPVVEANAAADSTRSTSTTSATTYRDPLPAGRQEPAPGAGTPTAGDPGRQLSASRPHADVRPSRRADGVVEAAGAPVRNRSRRRRDVAVVTSSEEPKAPAASRTVERHSPAQGAPAPERSAARSSALTVGDDLRVLRGQRRTRAVSLEDPFQ